MNDAECIKKLLHFIHMGARLDLKRAALEQILGLTGSREGIAVLVEFPDLLVSLLSLLDDNNRQVANDSAVCLINITADEKGAESLMNLNFENIHRPMQNLPDNVVHSALKFIFNPNSFLADCCCMILSNITRQIHLTEKVIDLIEKFDKDFDDIINIFTKNKYNKHENTLDYLGLILSNLSQSPRVRKYILDKEKCVIQRLLPFTEYKKSAVRRKGVIGTLKNCCFEIDYHEWLLSEVDILPYLLLPLAGSEEFDEEDNDKLPLELQYLPENKQREADPIIRIMLLETVTQLCIKKVNRQYIRDKNTYVILRELHKWETDKKALAVCESLVNILIRTEEEIGLENLNEVEIPKNIQEIFKKEEESEIQNCNEIELKLENNICLK